MAQNEINRNASSGEEDIQNQDQTTQRRGTDMQNRARTGQQNSFDRNDNDDRGISGMSSGADEDTDTNRPNAQEKKDSMDISKENTPH